MAYFGRTGRWIDVICELDQPAGSPFGIVLLHGHDDGPGCFNLVNEAEHTVRLHRASLVVELECETAAKTEAYCDTCAALA